MKLRIFIVLLFSGALLLILHFFCGINIFVFSWKAVGKFLLDSLRWSKVFIKKALLGTAKSIFFRRVVRPIYVILGLSWLISYMSKKFKARFRRRFRRFHRVSRVRWNSTHFLIKFLIGFAILVVAIIFGWGLWLVPISASFYMKLFSKFHVMWVDSVIRKKSRQFLKPLRKMTHRFKRHTPVRHVRNARCGLHRRDRKFRKIVDSGVASARRRIRASRSIPEPEI